MKKEITEKQSLWLNRVLMAEDSGLTRKQWCEENGVDYPMFKVWKRLLNKRGLLEERRELASYVAKNPVFVSVEHDGRRVHLFLEPAERAGKDFLWSLVMDEPRLSFRSGDRFLFVSPNRKRVHALWWNGRGEALATTRYEEGRAPWPCPRSGAMTAGQLSRLLDECL